MIFVFNFQLFSNRPWYKNIQDYFLFIHNFGIDTCETTLNSTVIKDVLNTKNSYDVVLMEHFNNDCMMAVAWILKAPVIGLSSCAMMPWHYDRLESPLIPSYMPTVWEGYSENMNFWQRLNNWITINAFNLIYR